MKFDFSKTYYKVIKKDHIHNDFKYKKGLNEDSLPFSYTGSCCKGGLYFFENITDIIQWLGYGDYLYEVTIPEQDTVTKDPEDSPEKYRAHKIILGRRRSFSAKGTWKWLIQNGFDIHADEDCALRLASSRGHAQVVRLLLDHGANIHADEDYALRLASENGHAQVVRLLLDHGANIHADVHADEDYALRLASENGHAQVVKILKEFM